MRHKRRPALVALGRTVKQLRDGRGLSQDRLAEAAGLSVKYLGQIENGRANPTVDLLGRVAASLTVDLTDLFTPAAGNRPHIYTITPRDFEQFERTSRIVMRMKRRAARAASRARGAAQNT